jgi:hypothetical protein
VRVLLVIERVGGKHDGQRSSRVVVAGSIEAAKSSVETAGWRVLRAAEVAAVHSRNGEAG